MAFYWQFWQLPTARDCANRVEGRTSSMTIQYSAEGQGYMARGREVFIRLSLLAALGVSCFLLLRPFLNLIISGIIIAIAIHPGYRMLTKFLHGRKIWAAVLCTLLLLFIVILPCVLLASTLTEGIRSVARQVQAGQVDIPPPPQSLGEIPLIGPRLKEFWTLCSTNLSEVVRRFSPQILSRVPVLLAASAAFGGVLLQFLISILLAGYLLATSEKDSRFADKIFARIFGERGPEFKELVTATVRSVTNGVLGVAAIQSLFATLGFWFVGLPVVGVWAGIFFVAAVLQVGAVALIPAVLYVFATQPTSHAVIFLVWCIIVGMMDNVLKPILLGRGSKVPIAVIFLGVIGGFILMNLIGLFVGAIVLSVGYSLFIAWLNEPAPAAAEEGSPSSVHV
jgi:predicted PurR-regulated permease PerM